MPFARQADADPWAWCLRLFTSCDLVGATTFKSVTQGAEWAAAFREFFRGFPENLRAAYDDLRLPGTIPADCVVPSSSELLPWKFSGDEILFHTELKEHTHVLAHLAAFKQSIKRFPVEWGKKHPRAGGLRLKGTAWLAGFPVTNTKIDLAANGNATAVSDFIGPSIDLGFRLTKFCDERKFVLSADLALMILDAVDDAEFARNEFHLHLHGLEPLKGVVKGAPYPIFWIDMLHGEPLLEDRLLGAHRDFRSDVAKDYIRKYLDSTEELKRPFIEGCRNPRYSRIDPELNEKRNRIRDSMRFEESGRTYAEGEQNEEPQEAPREPKPPDQERLRPTDDDDALPGVPG